MIAKFFASALFALAFLRTARTDLCEDDNIKGYYWRDFNGVVPDDALPAGLDFQGDTIYIGQVLHGKLIIPGSIYPNTSALYYEYFGPKSSTRNIMILCTRDADSFQWIETTDTEAHLLEDHAIIGGFEQFTPEVVTLIGRADVDGGISVGKVIIGENNYHTGLLTVKGSRKYHFPVFELLVYNNENAFGKKEFY